MDNRGDGHDTSGDLNPQKKGNVVTLKVPRKKKETRKTHITASTSVWGKNQKDETVISNAPKDDPSSEPLVNLPPYTKYFLGLIIGIHLIMTFALNDVWREWIFINLGFIPGRFTGHAVFEPLALVTPLSHMFIHGGWLHIAMNSIMLLAFGAGVEKWIGGPKMIFAFLICGLFGLAAHLGLNISSIQPVVGASGGLSGLFAVALVMLNRQSPGAMSIGKYGYWPLIALWVGISVLFGMMGSPDGGEIAWAAHVGGFLGGFVAVKILKL
jgi:membrane associated rhomboid family serine protease